MKFYNAFVLSALLYACESWKLTDEGKARFDAFDTHCQRKILQYVWSQHIKNSYIRSGTKQPKAQGNSAYNVLVIYNEWTWAVFPGNCTAWSPPTENKDLTD